MKKTIITGFIFSAMVQGILAQAPMSGQYTIGTGGNYTTIQNAITDLQNNGVNGPVQFNLAAETFDGFLTFPVVTGTSTFNTITFRGTSGTVIKAPVGTTTGNILWTVDGSDYVFRNLAFDLSAVDMNYFIGLDNSIHIRVTVDSCNFTGGYLSHGNQNVAIGTTGNASANISRAIIQNNRFITIGNPVSFQTSVISNNIQVNHNFFSDNYWPIIIAYCDSSFIQNNEIRGNNDFGIIIYHTGANSAYTNIQYNDIDTGTFSGSGISVSYLEQAIINDNSCQKYQFGIKIRDTKKITLERNTIMACYSSFQITDNSEYLYIADNYSESYSAGLLIYDGTATMTITGNYLLTDLSNYSSLGTYGLSMVNISNTSGNNNQIYNNIFESTTRTTEFVNCTETDFFYNTLALFSEVPNSPCVSITGSGIRFMNNLLFSDSVNIYGNPADSSHLYYLSGNLSNMEINGNGYYTSTADGNSFSRGDYNTATYGQFISATPYDVSSRFSYPEFIFYPYMYEPSNIVFENTTTPFSAVTTDINGMPRTRNFPGAVEGITVYGTENHTMNNDLKLYPNPAGDYITITPEKKGWTTVSLHLLNGTTCCFKTNIQPGSETINVQLPESLASGVYILELSNNSEAVRKKIIIKH